MSDSLNINQRYKKGFLDIAVHGSGPFLRGYVVSIKDSKRSKILELSDIYTSYGQKSEIIEGKWVRLEEPIHKFDARSFFEEADRISRDFLSSGDTKANRMCVGAVFPQEVGWRELGDGWIFVLRRIKGEKSKGHRKKLRYNYDFIRAGSWGETTLSNRFPSFKQLNGKKVAVFGLGCLGAPSAIELARCGVGKLFVVDHDYIEPGTLVRWPLGLNEAGKLKVYSISQFIRTNYPYTQVESFPIRIGAPVQVFNGKSEREIIEGVLNSSDLIYDATVEYGVNHLLSELAHEVSIPYISVSATLGVWGGTLIRIVPGKTEGCWRCAQFFQNEGLFPIPLSDEKSRPVQPLGCASPTFTGVCFDSNEVAMSGVRLAISTLCHGVPDTYPQIEWDMAVLNLRDSKGNVIMPEWKTLKISKHQSCSCYGK